MSERRQTGVVRAFDELAGLGEVVASGGCVYPFHCTQIVDGTRTISAGAAVTFTIGAGHLGRWEADAVSPLPAAGL